MDQYGYGARQQNPFDDRAGDGFNGNGFGAGLPQGPRGGAPRNNGYGDEYGSNTVEMSQLSQGAGSFGQGDPNAILNECRDINNGIDKIEQNLRQMAMLQQRSLSDADTSSGSHTNRELDSLSTDTMAQYRSLTERVRMVKSNKDSQSAKNNPQVTKTDRRLKSAINAYQTNESEFRKKTQDQVARQYRIVNPEASEGEIREAVQDSSGQVFQQAMMQSNRRGQAQSVLTAVQDRHAQLQKIEQQLIELAQLFQDMDTLVVQQEEMITQIEQKAEETVENFDKGNAEVVVAIDTARSTRKKKWICLAIIVGVIVVIVVAVVAYMLINKPPAPAPAPAPAQPAQPAQNNNGAAAAKRWIKLYRGETSKIAKRWVDSKRNLAPFDAGESSAVVKRTLPPKFGNTFVAVDVDN
ncbi:syntaxin 1B/2/3 [Apiospora aurea]|uniref:Syntaxin 1B/2/3 n=1 Tax=Apiospora aurea TaxID=335848 RepID=A0ABR1QRZ8_9PEZI